jgi:uncharacterized protein (DUF2141 family)
VQSIRKFRTTAVITALLIFALAPLAQGQQKTQDLAKSGTLVVMASGFKSGGGQFIMNVFATKAGYPLDSSKALHKVTGEVTHDTMEIRVEGIPFGNYAVTVLHDEDKSGKMTKGFLGMPKEAIGISNNPRSYFGAPDYEDAVFPLKENNITISINLHSH